MIMSITATELKVNLTNPYQNRVDIANSLFGILSSETTLEEAEEERLDRIVTRNVRDYSKSTVPVYQPPEFLSMICSSKEE